MPADPQLKGLFDRPINNPAAQKGSGVSALYGGGSPPPIDPVNPNDPCGFGYYMGVDGLCYPMGFNGFGGEGGTPTGPVILPVGSGGTSGTTIIGQGTANVTVNTAVSLTEQVVQPIADAINSAIAANSQIIKEQSAAVENAISKQIQEDTDQLSSSIRAASDNVGEIAKVTAAALAASTVATTGTVAASINSEITAVKNTITPILASITGFIDKVNAEVQSINDTFVNPLLNLYNSTVGTIATLTAAIEADLKEGIGGLLKLPGQVAEQLGSFDASLNRTVEQLGKVNKELVDASLKSFNDSFPTPFSAALSSALTGKSLANSLSTTFGDKVELSGETLSQVSATAIHGLGTILRDLMKIISDTFKTELDNMHANWGSVESMFVGLLDGALSLLTTLTAMGALAGPLIEAAEEEAHKLIPITKLDPATVVESLRRGFIQTEAAFEELRTRGFDASRSQVLIDLSVFLADANQALDWWYRGIIEDADLIDNLTKHGLRPNDITAYKQGSINLPALPDLVRWMNFGIITVEQFKTNAKAIRYDDAQIEAILATYRERESPQTLSQLSGLLDNSNAGFVRDTFTKPVPDLVSRAGERAGYHPDLTRYIWLSHWTLPPVETFIQLYFRGYRTKTELNERMGMANIPHELWDDLLQANHSLIPYRSIPSFVTKGLMTLEQADKELQAHGFDPDHRKIILAAVKPAPEPTNTTAVAAVHTLSQQNAKTLWEQGAITDEQYTAVLIAHGYDDKTAALQLKSDLISEHIKAQKQELAELTDEVLQGVTSIDDALVKLNTDGFTQTQLQKFQTNVLKKQKVNTKIPSLPELNKFLKAELIDLDTYTQALQQQGWQEPWLSAFLGLVSTNGVVAGQGGE